MNHALCHEMDPDEAVVLIALIRIQCAAAKRVSEIDHVTLRDVHERMTGTRLATASGATNVLPALTWTNAPDVGAVRGERVPANSQVHAGPNAMAGGSRGATSYIHPSVIVAIASHLKQLQPLPFLEPRVWRASLEAIGHSWACRTDRP